MYFICEIERKKREEAKDFLTRVFKFKKMAEKELKCKLKVIIYVDNQEFRGQKFLTQSKSTRTKQRALKPFFFF